MDGDQEYPTICGTGTEDYFGGAWNFEDPKGTYKQFTNLYAGLCQVLNPQGPLRRINGLECIGSMFAIPFILKRI